jgi:hypothetical protein
MKTTKIRGFEIQEGKCYKILIAKFVYYIKVIDISENPFVILGLDIYGKAIQLNLGKASLISEYDCESFDSRSKVEGKTKPKKKESDKQ